MESNTRFIIGVNLQDPEADSCVFIFQQDLFGEDQVGMIVPRSQVQNVESTQLAGGIADYYLKRYPDEQERVGRKSVERGWCNALLSGRWKRPTSRRG
jgi:hypothetical protein